MGRAPCCDKANVKRGPWSPEEDAALRDYLQKHGNGGNWISLPLKAGLRRCGKSCRLRWLNYLRPDIKHGGFTEEEDSIICTLHSSLGSRWSAIASHLPGRTDNDVKNYWNTKLKKKLMAARVFGDEASNGYKPANHNENTATNPRREHLNSASFPVSISDIDRHRRHQQLYDLDCFDPNSEDGGLVTPFLEIGYDQYDSLPGHVMEVPTSGSSEEVNKSDATFLTSPQEAASSWMGLNNQCISWPGVGGQAFQFQDGDLTPHLDFRFQSDNAFLDGLDSYENWS